MDGDHDSETRGTTCKHSKKSHGRTAYPFAERCQFRHLRRVALHMWPEPAPPFPSVSASTQDWSTWSYRRSARHPGERFSFGAWRCGRCCLLQCVLCFRALLSSLVSAQETPRKHRGRLYKTDGRGS